jgi:hypothetical protein
MLVKLMIIQLFQGNIQKSDLLPTPLYSLPYQQKLGMKNGFKLISVSHPCGGGKLCRALGLPTSHLSISISSDYLSVALQHPSSPSA